MLTPPLNVKLGSFTSKSCNDGKEMYKKALCTCKVIKLLFCQFKPIAFLPFSLPSPLLQLSIFDPLMTFRVFFLISYTFNQTALQPTPLAVNSNSPAQEHGEWGESSPPLPQKGCSQATGSLSLFETRKQCHSYM